MERTGTLLTVTAAIIIVVLLGALAMSFMSLSSANDELDHYREQQKQTAQAIMSMHLQDMQAARSWWTSTNQADYRELQNQGITVEADYIDTPYYTAVIDPANPYATTIGPRGNAEPGEIIVGLGQYFTDNMTRASGWSANYRINATTREVLGFTASLAQRIAYDNYVNVLSEDIYQNLGVSADSIKGFCPVTLDTSYLPETDAWLDVTEYRYSFKITDQPAYLTVKTLINGSTAKVIYAEVSQPYYTTVSTVIH
jgi:type II secretory pathway pseudopilin PulG